MPSLFEATAGAALGVGSDQTGSVTQATNKATAVTLNKVSFTVTNSEITASDVVVVNHASAGTAGSYLVQANSIAAGSFKITVANVSGGSLSEAIVLNYQILKAG